MMVIENKYQLGQIVYLTTDKEQDQRMVTQVIAVPCGIMYQLSMGKEFSAHYEVEISEEKNIEITVT